MDTEHFDRELRCRQPTGHRMLRSEEPSKSKMYCRLRERWTTMYMFVCVVTLFMLDVRLVDAPAEVTQEEGRTGFLPLPSLVLVVVVVVFFTLTDRASTIPSNIRGCQSGKWSQRGTKVNGSHHGDNLLLRPTRIQIATKCYATLHAMAPTNNLTVHQTSFTPYREQPRSTRIVVAPLCDHKRDWRLIGLWLTCCVTVVSSVARTIR